jgi:hypothetical protein
MDDYVKEAETSRSIDAAVRELHQSFSDNWMRVSYRNSTTTEQRWRDLDQHVRNIVSKINELAGLDLFCNVGWWKNCTPFATRNILIYYQASKYDILEPVEREERVRYYEALAEFYNDIDTSFAGKGFYVMSFYPYQVPWSETRDASNEISKQLTALDWIMMFVLRQRLFLLGATLMIGVGHKMARPLCKILENKLTETEFCKELCRGAYTAVLNKKKKGQRRVALLYCPHPRVIFGHVNDLAERSYDLFKAAAQRFFDPLNEYKHAIQVAIKTQTRIEKEEERRRQEAITSGRVPLVEQKKHSRYKVTGDLVLDYTRAKAFIQETAKTNPERNSAEDLKQRKKAKEEKEEEKKKKEEKEKEKKRKHDEANAGEPPAKRSLVQVLMEGARAQKKKIIIFKPILKN